MAEVAPSLSGDMGAKVAGLADHATPTDGLNERPLDAGLAAAGGTLSSPCLTARRGTAAAAVQAGGAQPDQAGR